MARALLNVPHEVLLDQTVELRNHLRVAADLRAVLAAEGIDGEALLARFETATAEAGALRDAATVTRVHRLTVANHKTAWCESVAAWTDLVRQRLAVIRDPQGLLAARVVRAALPQSRARRFAGAATALDATLVALEVHAASLGPWVADRLADGRALREAATALAAAEAEATAAAEAATAAVAASRVALQGLVRELRGAWAVARVRRPLLSPLPLFILEAYTPTPRAKRELDPVQSELDPVQGELEPVQSELEPVQSELDPVQGELDPVQGELDPVQGELDPVRALQAARTPTNSLRTPTNSPRTPTNSPRTPTNSLRTPTNSLRTPTNSPRTPTHSLGTVVDSLRTVVDARRTVIQAVTVVPDPPDPEDG